MTRRLLSILHAGLGDHSLLAFVARVARWPWRILTPCHMCEHLISALRRTSQTPRWEPPWRHRSSALSHSLDDCTGASSLRVSPSPKCKVGFCKIFLSSLSILHSKKCCAEDQTRSTRTSRTATVRGSFRGPTTPGAID